MNKTDLQVMINKYSEEARSLKDAKALCSDAMIEQQRYILSGMRKLMYSLGYVVVKENGRWCLRIDDVFPEIVAIADR